MVSVTFHQPGGLQETFCPADSSASSLAAPGRVFPYKEVQILLCFLPGLTHVLTAGAASECVDVYHDNGTDFISLSYAAHSAAYVKQLTEIDVIILDFPS